MCKECLHDPCHVRCPNYVPKPVHICDRCLDAILPGEDYFEYDGNILCMNCVQDCTKEAE